MEVLRVRLMLAADLTALVAGSARGESDFWTKERIKESFEVSSSRCYVLESAVGKILGHAIFQCAADEASLLNLGINFEFRRLGYGKKLLLWCLEELAGHDIRRVLLEVRCSNNVAIMLYEKLFFSRDGVRKDYYPSKNGFEDALLMSINIEGDSR